jgi:hypothetical protein
VQVPNLAPADHELDPAEAMGLDDNVFPAGNFTLDQLCSGVRHNRSWDHLDMTGCERFRSPGFIGLRSVCSALPVARGVRPQPM